MRLAILILILGTSILSYSQKELSYVGKEILKCDSVIVYAFPITNTIDLSDSSCCNMVFYRDSFNIKVKLTVKAKTELASEFIKPSDYAGRFASRSGFAPTEIIVLWTKGSLEYLKISRRTHDIFYSKGSSWTHINPFDVDKIDKFYKKYKITNE